MRELQKKHEGGECIYHRCFDTLSLSLSLSLSLFMMRRIHQFGTSFFITATSLSLLFFPSFPPCLWRGFDAFDFSVDEMMILDDMTTVRFSLSHSLSTRWYRLFVLRKSSLNNLSVMMNNIIKNRHRIHRLRRRLGISAAPERRFEEDTFFSQQQRQEQECSDKKLL